jgi:hypothetical protein
VWPEILENYRYRLSAFAGGQLANQPDFTCTLACSFVPVQMTHAPKTGSGGTSGLAWHDSLGGRDISPDEVRLLLRGFNP